LNIYLIWIHFFEKLEIYLEKKSKIIIQVPDIKYYMNNQLPLFYVHEHINYFTTETLELLLERKGFKIIGRKFGTSPSIIICAEYTGIEDKKNVSYPELLNKQKSFLLETNALKMKVSQVISEYETIIFYGMGLLAFWIGDVCLEGDDLKKIELVDDNIFYKDKLVPLFNKKLKIFPTGSNLDNTLILICTSPVYHEKIRKVISEKYTGNYTIAFIKKSELVLE